MKARGTAVFGALALGGLLAAYLTWQRPKDSVKADAVVVLSATKQSLDAVHFDDGTRFVEVKKHTDGETRWWVTLGFLPGKTPVVDAGTAVVAMDGGTDAGVLQVSVKPAEPLPTREMPANERAETMLLRFMPLEATRALGSLPNEKLDELGLVGSLRHLEVTFGGQLKRYTVGKPIPGIIGSYLQDEKGEVYLVQSTMFNELDPASQVLIDRRLHAFKQAEFDHLTLTLEGKTVDFVQTNAEITQTAKLARASSPEKADELAKNWHDKLWSRTVVTDVLGRGELPKAGTPKVALRLDYSQRGAKKGWLELGFDPGGSTWARSENTASWVGVHQGTEETIAEAKRLLE